MYYCPHCDDGPFSAADWWDHVDSHNTNAPWLQHRDPKNLDRTDLGYGEDLKSTTVPTHDMPNERDDSQWVSPYGWHEDLTDDTYGGGLSSDNPGGASGWNNRESAQVIPDAPTTPIPKAHKMVWLSQPNNDDLKFWHHRPTNTTYAWDGQKDHHWQYAERLGIPPFGDGKGNDWEGGFWNQQMGKHPADLWGLPSSTDYATVQGDGDYGNSIW